jgi:hypothetical protein
MERLKKMSKGYAADKPATTSTKASKKVFLMQVNVYYCFRNFPLQAAPAPRKRGAKIESDDEDDEAYSSTKRRKTTRVEEVEADDDEDDEEDGEVDVDEVVLWRPECPFADLHKFCDRTRMSRTKRMTTTCLTATRRRRLPRDTLPVRTRRSLRLRRVARC